MENVIRDMTEKIVEKLSANCVPVKILNATPGRSPGLDIEMIQDLGLQPVYE